MKSNVNFVSGKSAEKSSDHLLLATNAQSTPNIIIPSLRVAETPDGMTPKSANPPLQRGY